MYASLRRVRGLGHADEYFRDAKGCTREWSIWYVSRVFKVVHILAVIPATSWSSERAFSPFHWLKTYLCSTMEQQRVSNIAFINSKRAYANFVVNNGSYHWYLQPSKWQRQLFLLTCFWAHLIDSCVRNIYFTCRPMLIYRMTLVSLRLFHNNLGNLQEFFGQVIHSLPLPRLKMAPTPMMSLLSLTRHLISQIQKQLTNCGRIKALKPLDVQETLQRLISCLFVLWSINVLILTLRRWDIFLSPKSVFVHQWYKLQTCFVKLKLTAIFLSLFGLFS